MNNKLAHYPMQTQTT